VSPAPVPRPQIVSKLTFFVSKLTFSRRIERAAGIVAGLAIGWLALAIIVWAYGESPREIARQVLAGTWGMPYGIGQVLYKATTLLLTGVAVDVALRAGLFNIGVEGQLAVSGLAVASVGARLPAGSSGWVALPAVLFVALAVGALWAVVPALLRARFGANEVISTIMMNRIADAAVGLALARGLAIPGTSRTPDVVPGARLAPLQAGVLSSMRGSAVSVAWPLALVVACLVAAWIARARIGRELELVGLSPAPCAAEGIPVGRRAGLALLISGAAGGLAAIAPVLGYKGYYESGLGAGAGFQGIAVALIGRRSVVGLIFAALFFGTLEQGGLAINAHIPMEVTTILEAVAIVAVALADVRPGKGWRALSAAGSRGKS
jgi:general nucleoside transport system permease protein